VVSDLTSRNWAVWLHEYLDDFPGKQDVLRYALCANAPETKDNDFTWKDFQARNNNELVAILGNFVNRTLVLTSSYYGGKVPERGMTNKTDENILVEISRFKASIEARVFDAILKCESKVENGKLSTQTITEAFNEGLPEKDQGTSRFIGRKGGKDLCLYSCLKVEEFLHIQIQFLREIGEPNAESPILITSNW
jgi:hypothetical protein